MENERSFRLLRLLPGEIDEPLAGILQTHQLKGAPPYKALSYVWGAPKHVHRITIFSGDGVKVAGSLPLGSNLTDALRSQRHTGQEVCVWVDSICIDQSNVGERSKQVRIMADIYRSASEVVVWLGAETANSVCGMDALKYFVDPSIIESEAPWYQKGGERSNEMNMVSVAVVDGLQGIMDREWWFRLWTVQEAVLAQRVKLVCGQSAVCWNTDTATLRIIKWRVKSAVISNKWRCTDFNRVDLGHLLEVVQAQLQERAAEGQYIGERDLLDVAYDFRHRRAADPRDRIFAILGLAEGRKFDSSTLVDYTRTVEEAEEDFKMRLQALYPGVKVQIGI